MKNIWKYIITVALAGIAVAACKPDYPELVPSATPSASDFDVVIDVDQATNMATFTLKNKGMVPVWNFGSELIDGKASKVYAYTGNGVTLRFRDAGEHQVEVKAYNANGISESPVTSVREQAKSYSNETTTGEDISSANYEAIALPILHRLAEKVASRLLKDNVRANTVYCIVKTGEFQRHTRQTRLPASTNDPAVITKSAEKLLSSLLTGPDGLFAAGQVLRLIGVGCSGIDDSPYTQLDLFTWAENLRTEDARREEERRVEERREKERQAEEEHREKERQAEEERRQKERQTEEKRRQEELRAKEKTDEELRKREEKQRKLDEMLSKVQKKYGTKALPQRSFRAVCDNERFPLHTYTICRYRQRLPY